MKIGDKVFLPVENKWIEVMSIEVVSQEQVMHTIELESGDNFVVNGILVKTEKPKWGN